MKDIMLAARHVTCPKDHLHWALDEGEECPWCKVEWLKGQLESANHSIEELSTELDKTQSQLAALREGIEKAEFLFVGDYEPSHPWQSRTVPGDIDAGTYRLVRERTK
jgi:hypothetical protein